jgi:hypothetical protein
MDESEVQSAAKQMMRLHRSRALLHAGLEATKKLSQGDITGFHLWNRVQDAIKDLERKP